ncbi:MAG: TlpA disulfide reductase family protein [Bacteroidales bacterium]
MKRFFTFFVAIALLSCSTDHGYTIKGKLPTGDYNQKRVFLTNYDKGVTITDTATVVGDKFTFKGEVTTPEYYGITIDGMDEKIILFVENDNFKIEYPKEGGAKGAEVTGGETNTLLNELKEKKREVNEKYSIESLREEYKDQNTSVDRKREIAKLDLAAQEELKVLDEQFFNDHPHSFYTIYQLVKKVEEYPFSEMEKRVEECEAMAKYEGNRYLQEVKKSIERLRPLQPGKIAPDFSLPTPEGKMVSLSEIYPNHKITMIDFWAGWCGPCRRFNPKLVELYKKYNKFGFGIVGVSLDSKEEVWKDAIKTDKLTWVQLSDLKYWKSEVVEPYFVTYIPQNIFVDSEGKVIKRKVAAFELEEFIKKQLGIE